MVHVSTVLIHVATVVVEMTLMAVSIVISSHVPVAMIVGARHVAIMRHVVSASGIHTVPVWAWSDGSTWSQMRSVGHPHGLEVMPAAVVAVMTWHTVVIVSMPCVVGIDAEPPSIVGEDDWAVEVVVGHVACPLCCAEQSAESEVAAVEDVVVLCVGVSERDVVEILIHSVDIVEVDHIDCIEDASPQSQREGHAVGQETSVVAHHSVRHGLCIESIGCCQHHHCYKQSFHHLSHSRYVFVELVIAFLLRVNTLVLVFDAKVHNHSPIYKGLVLIEVGNSPNVSGNYPSLGSGFLSTADIHGIRS